jgi:hypothetical protein
MNLLRTLLLGLCFTGAMFGQAMADDSVGTAATVRGTVALERDGARVRLQDGAPILNGDIVTTGRDSGVRLLMKDESVLTLGAQSRFLVENFSTGDDSRMARYRLAFGRVRASVSQAVSSRSDIRFFTPTAVAGVRGTQLQIEYDRQSRRTTLSVLSGRVAFQSLDRRVPGSVMVGARQRSFMSDTGVSAAEDIPADELHQLQTEADTELLDFGDELAVDGDDSGDDELPGDDPSATPVDDDAGDESHDEEPTGANLDESLERTQQMTDLPESETSRQLPTQNPAGDQPSGIRVRW